MIGEDHDNCTGCYACYNVCPRECIAMETDSEGFQYPVSDAKSCSNCGLCQQICPTTNVKKAADFTTTAYAAINKDESIRQNSSSGGVFTLLAEEVINSGGVVFGAAFDDKLQVKHCYVETVDELWKLRGSKYVQSRIGDSFILAQTFLKQGRLVLYTGTPCQIGGLLSFLGKSYDNLITQDIICHGVPSPAVWEKYVGFREKEAAARTLRMFFRHKKCGWKTFSVLFEFSNSTEYVQPHHEDLYMKSFLQNLSLRPSCYQCKFKSLNRISDITLADFWGIEHIAPDMNDDKGTSLVLLNTPNAKRIFEAIHSRLITKEVGYEEAAKYNSAIVKSAQKPTGRETFIQDTLEYGFPFVQKKYLADSPMLILKKRIKKILGHLKKVRFRTRENNNESIHK